MRKWKLNLKSTFFSLLGYMGTPSHGPVEVQPEQLENLRQAMLDALGETSTHIHIRVARKLRFADDVQGLWYARSELMAVLSALHGETRAREELDRLTAQFHGLLPESLVHGAGRSRG